MKRTPLRRENLAKLLAEFLASMFSGGIGLAASISGISLILFPEIAALSFDVFTRPAGKWAIQPLRLITTPTITAALGVIVTRHWEYSAISVTIITLLSLVTIKLLRSNIGAAISAGVLPMVLGATSWVYPVAVFSGLVALAVTLTIWKQLYHHIYLSKEKQNNSIIADTAQLPKDKFWILALTGFVLLSGAVAQATDLRFILFPPLIVAAYELFGNPQLPGWMSRPVLFPLVCFLTASVGMFANSKFHAGFWGVSFAMVCSIAILRAFKVHMPPALAAGLIPFVIVHPTFWYPISVSLGASTLIASASVYMSIKRRRRVG